MTTDIAIYVELAVEADGPLVELVVGNGRVAIPVALVTGRRHGGIDLWQPRQSHRRDLPGAAST